MLSLVAVLAGGVAVGFAAVLWAIWTDREREVFGNGNGRWLE